MLRFHGEDGARGVSALRGTAAGGRDLPLLQGCPLIPSSPFGLCLVVSSPALIPKPIANEYAGVPHSAH